MKRAAGGSRPGFTPRQGQYLAFIHAYTLVSRRPPAQADMQRSFRVTPPSAHQMLLTLERDGLITRRPGVARSIAVLVDGSILPTLNPGYAQSVKTTVRGCWPILFTALRYVSLVERWTHESEAPFSSRFHIKNGRRWRLRGSSDWGHQPRCVTVR